MSVCTYTTQVTQLGSCSDATLVDNGNGTFTFTGGNTLTFSVAATPKYVENIPIGTTSIDITHNLGTTAIIFQMIDLSINSVVFPNAKITLSVNTTRFTFDPATTGIVQVVIL